MNRGAVVLLMKMMMITASLPFLVLQDTENLSSINFMAQFLFVMVSYLNGPDLIMSLVAKTTRRHVSEQMKQPILVKNPQYNILHFILQIL